MPSADMENEYGVGTKNRYNMGADIDFDDADLDPLELIRAAQEKPKKEKGAKKEAKPKNTKEKAPKEETPTEEINPEGRTQDRGERGRGRGGRGRGRGGERGGRGGERGGRGGERGRGERGGRGRGRGRGRGGFGGYNDENQDQSPQEERGFGGGFGNRGGFGNQDESHDVDTEPQSKFGGGFGSREDDGGERRAGRGGFRGRGRGGFRGRGREFDRRSGSDRSSSVKAFDKKEGSGSYNWGSPQDEIDTASEEHKRSEDTPKEEDGETGPTVDENANIEIEEPQEPAEPEPVEMSFDEWKKSQTREKPTFNLRKANDGESQFKGMKTLKKQSEDDLENSENSLFTPTHHYVEKPKTSGRVKNPLSSDFISYKVAANDNRLFDEGARRAGRGRGGRGGRGRGRGGRDFDSRPQNTGGFGSGPAGGSNADEPTMDLENCEEFPTLG